MKSTLLQYVDDLLICSESRAQCEVDSESLMSHLALKGHLESRKKIQWAQEQVEYLGCVIAEGTRMVSPKRVEALTCLGPPKDKASLLSFLGSIVYCRQWIPDCSYYDSLLRQATTAQAPKLITYTPEMTEAFQILLKSLALAPALGLANYEKPYALYCVVRGHAFAAVLAQMHGTHYRPVAYISKKLPVTVQGMPGCLQALAACAMTVKEAQKITLRTPTTLYTSHSVLHLLQNMNTQHMTTQRSSGYEIILTNTHNLTVKSCAEVTPAIKLLHALLKLPVTPQDCHDCTQELLTVTAP